jgi:mannitol-1-phosphate 5-dehydrogenase
MSDKAIVIWGAGKIGRGFIADLFHPAGYHLVLVDQSPELVARLQHAGAYTVIRAESADQIEEVRISGYDTLKAGQSEAVAAAVTAAGLLAVAVFPGAFADVARQLAPALEARHAARPAAALDILLCTNLAHAGPQFEDSLRTALRPETRDAILARTGIVETLVIRIAVEPPDDVRRENPLLVWTNGYPDLFVDRQAFKAALPAVAGLRPVDDMRAEEARKLYTYNLFQAALAYAGARRGYHLLAECIADDEVLALAEAALAEASAALQAAYGFAPDEMLSWCRAAIAQTNNPLLGDTVQRMAADPLRKLRREDRLVGPALLAARHGLPTHHLVRAIAHALLYDDPADTTATALQQLIGTMGLEAAVRQACELSNDDQPLIDAIVQAYHRLAQEEHWRALARQAYDLGFEYERVYHGCGQCTLATIMDVLGRPADAAFDAATGLAGGIGLAGEGAPCGALMGAVLAFGLVSPRRRENFTGDKENKYRTYAMAQEMRQRFLDRYGGFTCHEIHQQQYGRAFDLRDPAERHAFDLAGAHEDGCTRVVARAAAWAIEIIGEQMMAEGSTEVLTTNRAER